jgi:hypothetical protein
VDTALEVLKWIGVALAAGFVGYFGRYLAMMIIERMRRNKLEPPSTESPITGDSPPASTSPDEVTVTAQAKVDKKRAKAEAKKAKKEGKG